VFPLLAAIVFGYEFIEFAAVWGFVAVFVGFNCAMVAVFACVVEEFPFFWFHGEKLI
jgi:hypothetical protein